MNIDPVFSYIFSIIYQRYEFYNFYLRTNLIQSSLFSISSVLINIIPVIVENLKENGYFSTADAKQMSILYL